MIDLTKPGESAVINLSKGDESLIVEAQWGGGNNSGSATDLDLRCSVLMPDGSVYLIDGSLPGSKTDAPYVFHHGDVLSASKDEPGREIITVARDISKRAGGKVGLVFSVYSALDNGAVSVASLKPIMVMKYGSQVVNCRFDFEKQRIAGNVYTYVIGQAVVGGDDVTLSPSGKTTEANGEETTWPQWSGNELDIRVDGPAVFKGDSGKKSKSYNSQKGISKRFVNVADSAGSKGLFSKLFGG